MKIVLVTSELTYVPNNYDDVLEYVLRHTSDHIVGVVLVKYNKSSVVAKLPYFQVIGCKNITATLAGNIYKAMRGDKKKLLTNLKIPYTSTWDINDEKTISWLKALNLDLILNMRTRCIYKDIVLQVPRLGCVNIHHGLLPSQKGLFCDLHALANNEKTGFTIHTMTKRIDCGDILCREEVLENNKYMSYLKETALKEKVSIVNLIKKIASSDLLPPPLSIKSANTAATTTPNREMLREVQQKGIIL